MPENLIEQEGQWAQELALESGQTLRNDFGSLRLWITMLDREWQVRYERADNKREDVRWLQVLGFVLPGGDVSLNRYVRNDLSPKLRMMPALPDRSVVIRPYHPLYIPAGGYCTIYVSTGAWLRLQVGDKQTQLLELPIVVPSMTWVGKTTMDGELCYASNTFARLALEALPKRSWRVITPVRIVNRRKDALLLERFSLPSPMLPVFKSEQNWLWTPEVTVTCEKDIAEAKLAVAPHAPADAGKCELLCHARQEPEKGGLVKAFDRIFG
ncbi:hypothetical protein [Mangrovitalea sediminis]|uniref:hypothetical protein n=1 Tax=Mangrovitalea sediminis TaxID=1982043 RepID=UPI000BE5FDFF|nr:hypothetical protein [Mangrovitalea sediminis]